MSVKLLIESIEQARVNNGSCGATLEGKLNDLLRQIEDTKRAVAAEFEERDRDLVRLMEGAA